MCSWLSMAPLGFPVVPPVYRTAATSVRSLSTALNDDVPISITCCRVKSPFGQMVFSTPAEPRKLSRSSSLSSEVKTNLGFA